MVEGRSFNNNLTHSTSLKKNQSTPRPSEHPPVMGEKVVAIVFINRHTDDVESSPTGYERWRFEIPRNKVLICLFTK